MSAPEVWSISGLSVELETDRRTLNKRLSGLRPDAEGREAGKTVKRWKLSRVLRHLEGQGRRNGKDTDRQTEAVLDELHADKELLTRHLFPALVSGRFLFGVFPRHLHEDLGLTKVQALRCYSAACVMLAYAIDDFMQTVEAEIKGDPLPEAEDLPSDDTLFMNPPCLQELADLGPERYAAENWPDKAA